MNQTPLAWIIENLDEKYSKNKVFVIVTDRAKAPSVELLRRSSMEHSDFGSSSRQHSISDNDDVPSLEKIDPSDRSIPTTPVHPSKKRATNNTIGPQRDEDGERYPSACYAQSSPCSVMIPDSSPEWPNMTMDYERIVLSPRIENPQRENSLTSEEALDRYTITRR
eukprot:scaffold5887_cov122-Cylindrotheca_fusiformis.AAC.20